MLNIVLFWASNREESLALKIFHRIRGRGWTLFPVNPKYETIADVRCYPTLDAIEERIDMVIFMTNASISLQLLEQLGEKGVKKAWFQPDTFDDVVLKRAEELGLETYYHHCILVASKEAILELTGLVA